MARLLALFPCPSVPSFRPALAGGCPHPTPHYEKNKQRNGRIAGKQPRAAAATYYVPVRSMYVRLIIGLSFPSFPYAMAGWMAGCGTHALSLLFRPLCLPSANCWLCTLVMFEMTALCAERFDLRSAANPRGSRPLVLHITHSLGPRGATEGGRVVFAFFFFSRPAYWKGLGEDLPVARNLMAPVHAAPGLMMGPYPSPSPPTPSPVPIPTEALFSFPLVDYQRKKTDPAFLEGGLPGNNSCFNWVSGRAREKWSSHPATGFVSSSHHSSNYRLSGVKCRRGL